MTWPAFTSAISANRRRISLDKKCGQKNGVVVVLILGWGCAMDTFSDKKVCFFQNSILYPVGNDRVHGCTGQIDPPPKYGDACSVTGVVVVTVSAQHAAHAATQERWASQGLKNNLWRLSHTVRKNRHSERISRRSSSKTYCHASWYTLDMLPLEFKGTDCVEVCTLSKYSFHIAEWLKCATNHKSNNAPLDMPEFPPNALYCPSLTLSYPYGALLLRVSFCGRQRTTRSPSPFSEKAVFRPQKCGKTSHSSRSCRLCKENRPHLQSPISNLLPLPFFPNTASGVMGHGAGMIDTPLSLPKPPLSVNCIPHLETKRHSGSGADV